MEDIFRIVLYFQLFQSLHNFFSLGALWEDSIFGQFLIDVVGPCLYDVIRVWILCTNYRTNPVPDRKKKDLQAFAKKIGRFPKTLTRNRRIPLILNYFRSWPENTLRWLEVFWPRSTYTLVLRPRVFRIIPKMSRKLTRKLEGMAKKWVISISWKWLHR